MDLGPYASKWYKDCRQDIHALIDAMVAAKQEVAACVVDESGGAARFESVML